MLAGSAQLTSWWNFIISRFKLGTYANEDSFAHVSFSAFARTGRVDQAAGEEPGIRRMPSRSLSRMQIGGNVGKDGNRTHRTVPSVLFSPPPDLRLEARTHPSLGVAVDFRRLIKSKQEVMAT